MRGRDNMTFINRVLLTFAALLPLAHNAVAQDAMTLDQKVNETFASLTGPFVSLIFARYPAPHFPG